MNNAALSNYEPAINFNSPGACAAPAPIVIYPAPKPDEPIVLRFDVGAAARALPGSWFQVVL